jgi:hypothetical protein
MMAWRDGYIGLDRIGIISNINVDRTSGAIAIVHYVFYNKENEA